MDDSKTIITLPKKVHGNKILPLFKTYLTVFNFLHTHMNSFIFLCLYV